jgi:hypothetical protein
MANKNAYKVSVSILAGVLLPTARRFGGGYSALVAWIHKKVLAYIL